MTFGPLLLSVLKISVATLLMGVAVYAVSLLLAGFSDLLCVLSGIAVGLIVYLIFVFLLRLPESVWVKEILLKKRGGKHIS